jgi:hypothetical protein
VIGSAVEEYRTVIMAAGGAILGIVAIAVAIALVRRRRRQRAMLAPLPLIPFSPGRASAGPPRPDGTLPPVYAPRPDWAAAQTPPRSASVDEAPPVPSARSSFAPPAADVVPPAPRHVVPSNALANTARPNEMVDGAEVDGASMRYWRPADGTLQFLPGRLEVVAGRDAGQEIRFVRTPGPDGTRVTFGRAEGAPYRHVQLREPTVSRAHARMTLENGSGSGGRDTPAGQANGLRWRLENLSATNPVVVNGRPLAADGSAECSVSLGEGDRIEMGEVVFRFHEK